MQEREKGIILNLHDMLLELSAPDQIFTGFSSEAVLGEGGKHGVESRKRLGLDVEDTEGSIPKRRNGSKRSTQRNVVDRYHVDGVVNVGDKSKLDASLDHTPDEIIRIGYWKEEMSITHG